MQAQGNITTLGEILHQKRCSMGKNIDEISRQLRIQQKFLEALENNDYATLPGQAFTIGFLKSYALYLNLNPDELIERLKENFVPEEKNLIFPQILPAQMFPSRKVVYISIIALLLISVGFSTREITLPVYEPQAPAEPAEQNTTPIQKAPVKIKTLSKCWIEIKHKEKGVIFDKMLGIGEEIELLFQENTTLTIGNAAGIEVIINDKKSGPLGLEGDVMPNIPLDSQETFLQHIRLK